MITRMKNLLIPLVWLSTASYDGHLNYAFCYAWIDSHRRSFPVPLSTDILGHLDAVGQNKLLRKSGFDPALSILALLLSLNIDWAK